MAAPPDMFEPRGLRFAELGVRSGVLCPALLPDEEDDVEERIVSGVTFGAV